MRARGVAEGRAEAITARYKKLHDLSDQGLNLEKTGRGYHVRARALNEMSWEKTGRGYHVRARRGG